MKDKKEILFNFRISKDLITKFKDYCDKNGYSISKRLRVLIEKDIKK